jgi:hypothetical protein
MNTLILHLLVALIPLVIGAIYYNNALFGKAWMKSSGMTEEKVKSGNMLLIFGMTYLLSFLFSFMLEYMVVHSIGVSGVLFGEEFGVDASSDLGVQLQAIIDQYGERYNTFKHGAFHGFFFSIFIVIPITAVIAMFERRSFKYIMIHWGYWAITLVLMGGVLCQFTS